MSIITRLLPNSSDASGGDLTPTGPPTGWQALSDVNDTTWVSNQLSSFEPIRHLEGGYADLPVGVGAVLSAQLGIRAMTDVDASCGLQGFTHSTGVGTGVSRINVALLTDTLTTYLSAPFTTYTTKAQVDALQWGLYVTFVAHAGVIVRVTELWLDVDWNPAVSGFKGLLLSVLGPLVAVGLHEMPAIGRELLRRSRTRLGPAELERAWRELREDRGRRYFVLGA